MEEDKFWLKSQGMPAGPFTIAEIHTMLGSGDARWETAACRVGDGVWRSLLETPGFGPDVPPSHPTEGLLPIRDQGRTGERFPTPASGAGPKWKPLDYSSFAKGLLAVAAVVGVVYGLYELFRSPSALEVVKRVAAAEKVANAKRHVTPRFVKAFEYIERMPKTPDDPNDQFEVTNEVDGPASEVKHVGLKGSVWIDEAAKRVAVEGYFKVIRSDGWKVDDMLFTRADGQTLPQPLSVVDEAEREEKLKTKPKFGTGGARQVKPDVEIFSDKWFENNKKLLAWLGGGVALALLNGSWNWLRGKKT